MPIESWRRAAAWVALTALALWALLAVPGVESLLSPLSRLTAKATAVSLGELGVPVILEDTRLRHADGFVCEVSLACTALVPLALLAAGLFGVRVPVRRRALGFVCGAALLVLVNQVRLANLVWLGAHHDARFDFMHEALWPTALLVAGMVYFMAWIHVARRSP